MNKIVLCSTQRSGSTMICEDMRNAGVFGAPEEYFIPWQSYNEENLYRENLERLIKHKSTPNGVFAVKVMANQLSSIERCLNANNGDEAKVDLELSLFQEFFDCFADAHWVYIVRRDTLMQAISQVIAKQTGINHATRSPDDEHFAGNLMKGYHKNYNKNVRYNFHSIRQHFFKICEDNAIWLKFFKQHDISPYVIEYEGNRGKTEYLSFIAEMLEIDFQHSPHERKMVKMANEINDEWSNRFIADLMKSRNIQA